MAVSVESALEILEKPNVNPIIKIAGLCLPDLRDNPSVVSLLNSEEILEFKGTLRHYGPQRDSRCKLEIRFKSHAAVSIALTNHVSHFCFPNRQVRVIHSGAGPIWRCTSQATGLHQEGNKEGEGFELAEAASLQQLFAEGYTYFNNHKPQVSALRNAVSVPSIVSLVGARNPHEKEQDRSPSSAASSDSEELEDGWIIGSDYCKPIRSPEAHTLIDGNHVSFGKYLNAVWQRANDLTSAESVGPRDDQHDVEDKHAVHVQVAPAVDAALQSFALGQNSITPNFILKRAALNDVLTNVAAQIKQRIANETSNESLAGSNIVASNPQAVAGDQKLLTTISGAPNLPADLEPALSQHQDSGRLTTDAYHWAQWEPRYNGLGTKSTVDHSANAYRRQSGCREWMHDDRDHVIYSQDHVPNGHQQPPYMDQSLFLQSTTRSLISAKHHREDNVRPLQKDVWNESTVEKPGDITLRVRPQTDINEDNDQVWYSASEISAYGSGTTAANFTHAAANGVRLSVSSQVSSVSFSAINQVLRRSLLHDYWSSSSDDDLDDSNAWYINSRGKPSNNRRLAHSRISECHGSSTAVAYAVPDHPASVTPMPPVEKKPLKSILRKIPKVHPASSAPSRPRLSWDRDVAW